jgi:hypothetical protein
VHDDLNPQHLRFLNAVVRRSQGHRPAIEHLIDQQVHQGTPTFCCHAGRADLSLCFGPDMPYLPVERLASITVRM